VPRHSSPLAAHPVGPGGVVRPPGRSTRCSPVSPHSLDGTSELAQGSLLNTGPRRAGFLHAPLARDPRWERGLVS
jgi:hypothetical protein